MYCFCFSITVCGVYVAGANDWGESCSWQSKQSSNHPIWYRNSEPAKLLQISVSIYFNAFLFLKNLMWFVTRYNLETWLMNINKKYRYVRLCYCVNEYYLSKLFFGIKLTHSKIYSNSLPLLTHRLTDYYFTFICYRKVR